MVDQVELLELSRELVTELVWFPPAWVEGGLSGSGRALMQHGFQTPELPPDQPILLAVRAE
ncbi:MAG: hypothetical protein LBR27_10050 [Bifidobacteriaceae bacterium]|nr:hypothetical protein [Bifidobacteriaceae bacterium]